MDIANTLAIQDKWNDTAFSYEQDRTLHSLFEDTVEKFRDKIALRCKEEILTYGQLNEKANQIARKLRDLGVKPDSIVALMCTRSVNMFIGVLGILKAGGCYLPIDSEFPAERIQYMLEDSKADILVVEKKLEHTIEFTGKLVRIEEDGLGYETTNLDDRNKSNDLAYVIYTSGSTGNPKGVMLEHKSVHNFIHGMCKEIAFTPDKTIVSLTTISFDIFILESILPLTIGMEIVVAEPMNFLEYVKGKQFDMLQTTPSTMKLILKEQESIPYIEKLTDIMLGGEPFPESLLEELKKISKANIYNMYGPTETTVWSTVKDLSCEDKITIGRPIVNTCIYILDEDNNLQEPGTPGELCIGGDGVARGYLFREDLTRERFIIHPDLNGKRLYRTGDVATWLENGELKFLGRMDSQVKVRGFRIELGEIENVLSKMKEIETCVVALKELEADEKTLVAYYISREPLVVSDMIHFLRSYLPEYMLPGVFMQVNEIPYTPNGKIDRNALPLPDRRRPLMDVQYVEPATAIELELSKICKKILNKDMIGIYDNFFELGGNSVLISQISTELKKKYANIDITDIFAYPCVHSLAEYINKSKTQTELKFAEFPKTFYSNSLEKGKRICAVILPNEKRDKIEQMAMESGVEAEDIFIILYLYTLSQICESKEVSLLLRNFKENQYEYVKVDFEETEDLFELCRKRNQDKKENKKIDKNHNNEQSILQNVVIMQQDEFEELVNRSSKIIPVFQMNKPISNPFGMEFGISIYMKDETMKLEVVYDVISMKQDKAREVLSYYVDLLYMITEQ